MAKFHDACRAKVDAAVPMGEPVAAVVMLMSITGGGHGATGSSAVGVNYEDQYVRKQGLDPELRIKGVSGTFGLVVAQTSEEVHFFYTTGLLRKGGVVTLLSSQPKVDVEFRHQKGGFPGLRQRLMHFTFADGQYFVGSSSDMRLARTAMNQPREFVAAWGPSAVDNKAD